MKHLVFIVEDDLTQQKLLRYHFEEGLGTYEVKCFTNPDDLLVHLDEKPFAVVLDHFFADRQETGLHYLSLIKKKSPAIPVIYHTTLVDEAVKTEALKKGAVEFINKDMASLVRLRTALDAIHKKKSKKGFLGKLFGG
jgi:DNA-binding NtrC family response regulator